MTQNFAFQPWKNQAPKRSLVQGIGLIGTIGILNSGLALAQTAPNELAIPELPPEFVEPSSSTHPVAPDVVPLPLSSDFSPVPPAALDRVEIPTVVLPGSKAGYDAPTSIVLSERSSGCQTVLRNGQAVPGSICPPSPIAPLEVAGASGVHRGSAATRVGDLSVVNPSSNVWDYYKRTVRPPGRLGNGNIRLIFPLAIPAPISSMFGWRTHPITGDQRFHAGTDLAAPMGTPVLAAVAGQVAIADFLGGYGLAVSLEHNKGSQQTLYAHLSEIFVKPGEWVKQGETIGRVGSTGNSTGPHLHFEFRQLTPEGWVAMDAGQQLEYALAQLVKAMQVAQKGQSTRG